MRLTGVAIYRAIRRFGSSTLIPRTKETLNQYPFISNALIYGGLYSLAEVSRQTIKNSKSVIVGECDPKQDNSSNSAYDVDSIKRYAIMGTAVYGPWLTKWYIWLDGKFPCNTRKVVLKKLLLDQFFLTPFMVAVFYVGMSFLENVSNENLFNECNKKFLPTFTLDCCYWLPIQALNFFFVPSFLRVAYVGVTTFIWLNVLAYIKAMPTDTIEKVEHELIKKEKDFIKKETVLIRKVLTNKSDTSSDDQEKDSRIGAGIAKM
jgi:Mpv17-like protein